MDLWMPAIYVYFVQKINENHMIRLKFKQHMDEYSKLEAQLWTQILSLILSIFLPQNLPKPADEYDDEMDPQLNIKRQ